MVDIFNFVDEYRVRSLRWDQHGWLEIRGHR
jgi:hypothetical protein